MSDPVYSATPAAAPGVEPVQPTVTPQATSTADTAISPLGTTTSTGANGTDLASKVQNAGVSALNSAQATLSSISNSQAVQDIKNGPVAQNVSREADKTTSEMKDIYGSKTIPAEPAATGQPLTHYHSMFYRLLSWENPRATAISFVGTLVFIVLARYLDVLHYLLKFAYFLLGVTASLEIAGKLLFNDGIATKMRPRQYWTVPRDALERSLDDVEQLVNFFVIEAQRIVYAENVYATVAVFFSALISYWLIKLMPFWGLAFTFTCVAYLGPLVYVNNREAIDSGLGHVSDIVSTQAVQIKNITAEQTGKATESLKTVTAEYTNKATEFIGPKKADAQAAVSGSDFPAAPKQDPVVPSAAGESEPLLAH